MVKHYFSCSTGWRFRSNYSLSSLPVQCKPNNTFAAPDVWPTCANGKTFLPTHCQKM